jgi:hypothetical protein
MNIEIMIPRNRYFVNRFVQYNEIMKEYICYCFEYTAEDIIEDLKRNRHSTILDRIIEEKSKNTCYCEKKHPEHR